LEREIIEERRLSGEGMGVDFPSNIICSNDIFEPYYSKYVIRCIFQETQYSK